MARNSIGAGQVINVADGRILLDVKEPILNVAAFSADGSRFALGTMNSVRVWDLNAAKEVLTINNTGGPVGLLTFSPDGARLAGAVGSIYTYGEVKVWDITDGRELLSLKGQTSVHDLVFSPDGGRLAGYRRQHDNDGIHSSVTIWGAVSGLPLLQIPIPEGHGDDRRLLFQPDGARLFLVNPYARIRVTLMKSGTPRERRQTPVADTIL